MESVVGSELLVWTVLAMRIVCLIDGAVLDVYGSVPKCVVISMRCSSVLCFVGHGLCLMTSAM